MPAVITKSQKGNSRKSIVNLQDTVTMIIKTLAIAATVAVCALPTALFAKTHYTCTIKEFGNSNWIPPRVDIIHDEATGEVMVHDGIIYSFNDGKPLPAKISTENNKRITFVWVIEKSTNSHGQFLPRFQFRASYLKPRNVLSISATPVGYANNFKGEGPCVKKQIK